MDADVIIATIPIAVTAREDITVMAMVRVVVESRREASRVGKELHRPDRLLAVVVRATITMHVVGRPPIARRSVVLVVAAAPANAANRMTSSLYFRASWATDERRTIELSYTVLKFCNIHNVQDDRDALGRQ